MGLENRLHGDNAVVSGVNTIINWARKNSLWPCTFGLACCALEMMATMMPHHDMARFGAEVFRPTPRQSDLLIVAGTVTNKMAPQVKLVYDQMTEPKWVIAMGACACSGGQFKSYATLQGVDRIIPVDVYVPGCPPRMETLLASLMKLQEKIKKERVDMREDVTVVQG